MRIGRSNKLFYIMILLTVATVTFVGLRGFRIVGTDCGPTGATKSELSSMATAVDLYVRLHGQLPDLNITNVSANAQLFSLLSSESLVEPVQSKGQALFLDKWGQPFNVVRKRNSRDGNGICTCDRHSIVIWSNGRNGKNEAGIGDDISAECYLGVKTVFREGKKVYAVGEHYLPEDAKSRYGE